jgi:nitroimidazol reductase NimA-like FMN-containing flavoprotein (pyridoxamine 5'-phosphate oxidase superfamily)
VPTARTTIRRYPERGEYNRSAIDSILDEALICHVGFVSDSVVVLGRAREITDAEEKLRSVPDYARDYRRPDRSADHAFRD